MNIKVSIIVPVYNVDKYLNRCIKSLVAQTLKEIEIILVDDGSTDNSKNICLEWINRDKRIKLIEKTNGGLSSARNAGLQVANGEYIGFVDSDDYVNLDMYEKLYSFCIKNNVDIASCGIIEEYYDSSSSFCLNKRDNYLMPIEAIKKMLLFDMDVKTFAWDKLYKKSVVNNIQFTNSLKYAEDTVFLVSALLNSQSYASIKYCGYHYMRRPDSLIGDGFKKIHIQAIEAADIILRQLDCLDDETKKCASIFKYQQIYILINRIINSNYRFDQELEYLLNQLNDYKPYFIFKNLGFSMLCKSFLIKHFFNIYVFMYKFKKS